MKTEFKFFMVPATLLLLMSVVSSLQAEHRSSDKPLKSNITLNGNRLQIPFVANKDQTDERVKFYAKVFGGTVFVTKQGDIVYSLSSSKKQKLLLKEEFLHGKICEIEGEEKSATVVNLFKGKDPLQWRHDIPTYGTVNLGEVYKGIELKLKAYGNTIEKLFHVKPGGNPDTIQLKLSGSESLHVNKKGELEIETLLGTVIFTKPIAYQEIDGNRVEVEVDYQIAYCGQQVSKCNENLKSEIRNLQSKSVYGFTVASYDKSKELIIDPLLSSTYLGSTSDDLSRTITMNSNGDIYVAGWTMSSNLPINKGAYDDSYNKGDYDAFIIKLNRDLTSMIASTYLGGEASDFINSMTIDSSGNICIVGETSSTDFPTTSGTYGASYKGGASDTFVSKLNGDLTKLLASTYVGGTSGEVGKSIALDYTGNIFISGHTYSSDFPISNYAYDSSHDGYYDIFISKLSGDLRKLKASTYLGGSGYDYGESIAVNSEGDIYITGNTWSSNFPVISGAYDTTINGTSDVFISKIKGDLTKLITSTYLGGSDYDYGESIIIDSVRNVSVVGQTYSSNFPVTPGAYDTSKDGSCDVFVSILSENLTSLLASTFLGGSSYDYGQSITTDIGKTISGGNIYVSGYTNSPDFPVTPNAYDTYKDGVTAVFISKLNSDLTRVLSSTFLGGSLRDYGYSNSIVIDPSGNVYVAGWTESPDFPVTINAFNTSYRGGYDAFVSKLDSDFSALSPTLAPQVFTEDATDITPSSATLNGMVNAKNLETQVWFEYDTTSGRYRRSTPKKTISGSVDTLISADISGLSAEPIYYYRIVAQNKAGITYGRQVTFTPCIDYYEPNDNFTTAYGPLLSGNSYNGKICSPSDVDYYKIILTRPGRISVALSTPKGKRYILQLYDSSQNIVLSTYDAPTDLDILTLTYNASTEGIYYIQVLGHSGEYDSIQTYTLSGTWQSAVLSFPPVVSTGSAQDVTSDSAILRGIVNANLTSTTAWFEYGTTSRSYTNTTSKQSVTVAADTPLSAKISGLKPGTTYYYRIVAQNDVGITYGGESKFVTEE